MMTKKKQSFLKEMASKITTPFKKFGKKYGLPAVFAISGIFAGNTKAHAAPAEKTLADSLTTEIMNSRFSVPSDNELKELCNRAAFSEYGQQLFWENINEMLEMTGENVSEYAAQIQGEMKGKSSTSRRKILNEYLGQRNLGVIGKTTVQNAPGATCSWGGARLICLSAQSVAGGEELFSPYTSILDNVNYASASFGNSKVLKKNNIYKNLLQTSATNKNIKKSLEEDIKNHPTDIFIVAEYSARANSKHHIITVVGDEYQSFNRERIGDSHRRIKSMRQRYYINVSEFIRQSINKDNELEELSGKIFTDLKAQLTQKKLEGFFVRKLASYAPITENNIYSRLATDLTMQNFMGGENGNKIIQNWQNEIRNNTQNIVAQAMASDNISEERKEAIKLMHKDFAVSDTFAPKNQMTEEEALLKIYDFNIKASGKALKQIRKDKSLSADQQILCAHAITNKLEQAGFLQKEDAHAIMATLTNGKSGNVEYSVTAQGDDLQLNWQQTQVNEKKVKLQQKRMTYRTARKAAKMTRQRLKKNLESAVASQPTNGERKVYTLKGTYKRVKTSSQNAQG